MCLLTKVVLPTPPSPMRTTLNSATGLTACIGELVPTCWIRNNIILKSISTLLYRLCISIEVVIIVGIVVGVGSVTVNDLGNYKIRSSRDVCSVWLWCFSFLFSNVYIPDCLALRTFLFWCRGDCDSRLWFWCSWWGRVVVVRRRSSTIWLFCRCISNLVFFAWRRWSWRRRWPFEEWKQEFRLRIRLGHRAVVWACLWSCDRSSCIGDGVRIEVFAFGNFETVWRFEVVACHDVVDVVDTSWS